jgi:hypothetical protein
VIRLILLHLLAPSAKESGPRSSIIMAGTHPTHGDRRDNLKTCYENRKTGSVTYDTPVEWFSDGSLHSLATVDRDSSDEYSDDYTNISTVRFNDDTEKRAPAKNTGHAQLARKKKLFRSSQNTPSKPLLPAKMSSTSTESPQKSAPPDSFGPASAKLYTTAQLKRKRKQFRSGQSAPDLKCVPVPHGADWCDVRCLDEGEDLHGEELPPECGYHPRFGDIIHCSDRCPGGWCQHTRQMDGRDFMS